MEYQPIEGEGRMGDFVHGGQDMAAKQGFGNVSKLWYDKTISYDDGIMERQPFAHSNFRRHSGRHFSCGEEGPQTQDFYHESGSCGSPWAHIMSE